MSPHKFAPGPFFVRILYRLAAPVPFARVKALVLFDTHMLLNTSFLAVVHLRFSLSTSELSELLTIPACVMYSRLFSVANAFVSATGSCCSDSTLVWQVASEAFKPSV